MAIKQATDFIERKRRKGPQYVHRQYKHHFTYLHSTALIRPSAQDTDLTGIVACYCLAREPRRIHCKKAGTVLAITIQERLTDRTLRTDMPLETMPLRRR
jgi:hypothetical protein